MSFTANISSTVLKQVLLSKFPLAILLLSIFAGFLALNFTPREEEPQISVPMIDVMVTAPGVGLKQVERTITTPLEKLLAQVSGVEHVYSVTNTAQTVVTLRFHVGENREKALLNTYNKLHSNTDKIPTSVNHWQVKPIEVDEVPIMMLGLWSSMPEQVSDYDLRRLAEEVSTYLKTIEDTSEVHIIGGRTRDIQINLNPEQMSARQVAIEDVIEAIQASNTLAQHGDIILSQQAIQLESGDAFRDIATLSNTPIQVIDGAVVLLKDIAHVLDGPSEQKNYTWLDFNNKTPLSALSKKASDHPMVTLSIAKQKGSNAVTVSQAVSDKIQQLQQRVFPANVHVEILRDYGETANEKVNNLTTSLLFAVFTVVVFIGVFLGWRSALVVGLAVPVCYGITLSLDLIFGYTINRVTLFALILSLGLLVDDPITGVDNIARYLKKEKGTLSDNIVAAISEIRTPLLMSTLTIVLAFLPLAFITGMMGPYMAPMAFNVPLSVISSTLVAFFVTPWLAAKLIKKPTKDQSEHTPPPHFEQYYRKILSPLIHNKQKAKRTLYVVLGLFILSAMLPVMRLVPLKLLPFDNKNELQVIIDMPEFATLEQTAAIAKKVSIIAQKLPEVTAVANYVGTASPIDFNGMVRQYYQRQSGHQADLRILLLDKTKREHQSHAIVLRLRALLAPLIASTQAKIKVVEVPPGPPVLSTLVAEIYGDEFTPYQQLQKAAATVETRFKKEPFVVEVDSTVGDDQPLIRFKTDKVKAALSGISTHAINQSINVANQGKIISHLHADNEATPLPITLQLPIAQRSSLTDLKRLTVKGQTGVLHENTPEGIALAPKALVALGELGAFESSVADKAIYHKDLARVVYVTADISGRTPAGVIADITGDFQPQHTNVVQESQKEQTTPWQSRTFLNSGGNELWQLPDNIHLSFSGEGEWRITIRVFRDMGLAFVFALMAIFIVLRIQTGSAALSGIIMSAIPLTVIGIMPGFFLLNQFGEREIASAPDPVLFTATAMIGMIALAGIVVRNSLILIEYITQARQQGMPLTEALLQAGTVRMRPVLLTAGTTLLGNLIITLDPVFSGLAIAIMFGIISSTVFTLLVVPIVYVLVFDDKTDNKNGLVQEHMTEE